MNIRWVRSNATMLVLLVIAMVAVGTLALLVNHQQQRQLSTLHGQLYLGTAPAADAPRELGAPAPAIIAANPAAAAAPNPATNPGGQQASAADPLPKASTPGPANAPALPAPAAVPAPQVITAPEPVSSPRVNTVSPVRPNAVSPNTVRPNTVHRVPLQPTTPHRQATPVAPPHPQVPAPPAIPAPVTDPDTHSAARATTPDPDQAPTEPGIPTKSSVPAKSDVPAKPGKAADSPEKGSVPAAPIAKPAWPYTKGNTWPGSTDETKIREKSSPVPFSAVPYSAAPSSQVPFSAKKSTLCPPGVPADTDPPDSNNSPTVTTDKTGTEIKVSTNFSH